MAFAGVPRPGGGLTSESITSGVSGWFDNLKAQGQSVMNSVNDNQYVKAATERTTQMTAGVTGAVTQQVGSQAESMKSLITGQQKEPESAQDYMEEAMTMSYKNRLIAFVVCLACGIFFTALSSLMLPFIVIKPHKFAVSYSLGNVLMLGSTMFLVGPKKQLQNMCVGHRAMASCAYIGSLVGTIYAALGLRIYLLVIVFIAIQFASLIWYSLSYIPFGRQLAQRFLKPAAKIIGQCCSKTCSFCASRYAPNLLPR